MAVARGQVPQDGRWSWHDLLAKAAETLTYAFEKSDAVERWGHGSGMSLRVLAERVMGSNCMMMGSYDIDDHETRAAFKAADKLYRKVRGGRMRQLVDGGRRLASEAAQLFSDVGGQWPWQKLIRKMPEVHRGYL